MLKNSEDSGLDSRPSRGSHADLTRSNWWQRLLRETRTRILLTYALLMATVTALSIPLFMLLFLHNVDRRVREDLHEEMENFQNTYESWKTAPDYDGDLKRFARDVLGNIEPEDDNSLIFYVDGEYYKSNPMELPPELSSGSDTEAHWLKLTELTEGQRDISDPNIGSVIYLAQPLEGKDDRRGLFVVAHTTAGEQQEALDGIFSLAPIVAGVFVIGLGLAWFSTGRLLKPVHELATTARSISESDLSQRITPVDGSGELAELATTFNKMMNRLQDAFTSQRNFINDAGHELRTPITIIQGYLELLDDVPPEMNETIEIVQDELDRMARLVNDMILLAKSERPDFLQLETIEIVPFAKELLHKAQTLAKRNWQLKQMGQGVLVADRQRLTGAVLNLLNNAAQHTQPDDLIELGVAVQQQVRFWVRDTGEGIALSDQARIFERFARVTNSRRRSEGSGLGLAIVQAIAEAHGGQVELSSKPGHGSIFTLILPLDSPKEPLTHAAHLDR